MIYEVYDVEMYLYEYKKSRLMGLIPKYHYHAMNGPWTV